MVLATKRFLKFWRTVKGHSCFHKVHFNKREKMHVPVRKQTVHTCLLHFFASVNCKNMELLIALHCNSLHYNALQWHALPYTPLHYTSLHCLALLCTPNICTAQIWTALHCTNIYVYEPLKGVKQFLISLGWNNFCTILLDFWNYCLTYSFWNLMYFQHPG